MDEKAFQAALVAWTDSAHTKHYAKLQDAIAAYEQARERVAVPSAEELADDIEGHWFSRTGRAEFILNKYLQPLAQRAGGWVPAWSPYEMASSVCASVDAPVMKVASAIDAFLREHGQRPAPSAQPWTRDQLIAVYMDAFPTLFSSRYDIEQGGGTSRDIDRIVASLNKLFGPTAHMASAQGGVSETTRLKQELERERLDNYATDAALSLLREERDNLKRDLAAERAALQKARDAIHKIADAFGLVDWSDCGRYVQADDSLIVGEAQTLSKRLATSENARTEVDQLVSLARGEDPSIDNSESWLSEMAEQFEYDLDKNYPRQIKMQLEQLTDDYTAANTDRAAAEKRVAELEREVDRLRAEFSCVDGAPGKLVEAESRVAELERERDEARAEADKRSAICVSAIGERNAALGELERERDEARQQLELADERRNVVAEQRDRLQLEMAGERDETERVRGLLAEALKSEAALQQKLAELDRERDEALQLYRDTNNAHVMTLHKLDALRNEANSLIAEYNFREQQWRRPVDLWVRLTRLQGLAHDAALAKESAKPAEPTDGFTHDGAWHSNGQAHECKKHGLPGAPGVASEPKPGDVLSGEAAKAYMLANPGRELKTGPYRYRAQECGRFEVDAGGGWSTDTNANDKGYAFRFDYVVLPPEPAKPATPGLDLAGRVTRLEKFARHVLEAFGKLTTEHGDGVATLFGDTSLADALKALEGGGSQ